MVKVTHDEKKKNIIVLPKHSKEGWYVDGYLLANLQLYQKLVKKDRDCPFILSGMEGEGKTTLGATICKTFDPSFNIDRCFFDGDSFLKALIDADENDQYKAYMYDEAQEFTSRGAMSAFNKKLIEVLSKIRAKNLYICLCIPSFFELEKYASIHRTRFLIEVYSVKGDRGFFKFWNWERKKLLYLKGKKNYDYNTMKANFIGTFTDSAFPFDKAEYNVRKFASMARISKRITKANPKQIAQRDFLIWLVTKKMGWVAQKDLVEMFKERDMPMDQANMSQIYSKFE